MQEKSINEVANLVFVLDINPSRDADFDDRLSALQISTSQTDYPLFNFDKVIMSDGFTSCFYVWSPSSPSNIFKVEIKSNWVSFFFKETDSDLKSRLRFRRNKLVSKPVNFTIPNLNPMISICYRGSNLCVSEDLIMVEADRHVGKKKCVKIQIIGARTRKVLRVLECFPEE